MIYDQNEFLGADVEARSVAFSAIINLVYSNDWEHLTARQEWAVRKKLIKLAEKLDNGVLNSEQSVYSARQWAEERFEERKASNETQGHTPRHQWV